MRKFVFVLGFAIIAILSLAGCLQPVAPEPAQKYVVVKNSVWETVDRIAVSPAARDIYIDDYNQVIEVYNSSNISDFLRAYPEDSVPDIEHAPPVDVFVCNPVNYNVNSQALGVLRVDFARDIELWRTEAQGQLLFIDHVPPPPIVMPPPSLYAFYAIYEVDNATGEIVLEDHCGYQPDESFTGQWITDPAQGGWTSVDAYYQTILGAYTSDCRDGRHRVVTRQLYTPPSP